MRCHDLRRQARRTRADPPRAQTWSQLGGGWALGEAHSLGSAIYLRGDALLEVFAGRKTEPTDDLVLAAHLAPAWLENGRSAPRPTSRAGEHTQRSAGHILGRRKLRGEAVLDGRAIRWSYLEWRCLQRARTYGALVVSEALAEAKNAAAAPTGGWTGHDAALLAVHCHG